MCDYNGAATTFTLPFLVEGADAQPAAINLQEFVAFVLIDKPLHWPIQCPSLRSTPPHSGSTKCERTGSMVLSTLPLCFSKGEGLTKARAGKFITSAFLVTLTSANLAGAQSQANQQTAKEQQPAQQSTNQIVADEQKPLAPKNPTALPSEARQAKPAEPKIEIDPAIVTPPAPVIVKRSSNVIAIPAEGADPDPKTKPDSKYEERPAVSSSVNVGSSFGYRRDPFTRRARFHSGVDIKARWGDPVGASQAGTVQFAGWYYGYGNMIIINHGGGVATRYAHRSSFDVQVGERVRR